MSVTLVKSDEKQKPVFYFKRDLDKIIALTKMPRVRLPDFINAIQEYMFDKDMFILLALIAEIANKWSHLNKDACIYFHFTAGGNGKILPLILHVMSIQSGSPNSISLATIPLSLVDNNEIKHLTLKYIPAQKKQGFFARLLTPHKG